MNVNQGLMDALGVNNAKLSELVDGVELDLDAALSPEDE